MIHDGLCDLLTYNDAPSMPKFDDHIPNLWINHDYHKDLSGTK